jgi:hypothetical protein
MPEPAGDIGQGDAAESLGDGLVKKLFGDSQNKG